MQRDVGLYGFIVLNCGKWRLNCVTIGIFSTQRTTTKQTLTFYPTYGLFLVQQVGNRTPRDSVNNQQYRPGLNRLPTLSMDSRLRASNNRSGTNRLSAATPKERQAAAFSLSEYQWHKMVVCKGFWRIGLPVKESTLTVTEVYGNTMWISLLSGGSKKNRRLTTQRFDIALIVGRRTLSSKPWSCLQMYSNLTMLSNQ